MKKIMGGLSALAVVRGIAFALHPRTQPAM
jgi:hypothetical protein